MARTIIIDEIKKDSAATGMSVDGVAKVWAFINHQTTEIKQSHNVSSFTDNGNGDGRCNYISFLNASDYCLQVSGKSDDNNADTTGNRVWVRPYGSEIGNGSYFATDEIGIERDQAIICFTTFGDLA